MPTLMNKQGTGKKVKKKLTNFFLQIYKFLDKSKHNSPPLNLSVFMWLSDRALH